MKTGIATLSLLLCALPLLADEGDLHKVLKEREAVLAKLVALAEARQNAGDASELQVFEARMKLLKFRFETTKDPAEKISIQEGIVKVTEENERQMITRFQSGMVLETEVLLAKDKTLAERQILLTLRPPKS